MKKIFTLIAAMMMTAAAAQAQSFVFLHNQDDDTVVELADGASYSIGYTSDDFGGVTTLEWNAGLGLRFESVVAEFVYEVTVEGAPEGFNAQTCPDLGTNCYPVETGKPNVYRFSQRVEEGTVTNLDLEGACEVAVTAPITMKVRVYEADFEDEAVTCNVIFAPVDKAGITAPAVDNAANPEYFDLRGVRVANPAEGQIVIRRHGSDVTKTLVR